MIEAVVQVGAEETRYLRCGRGAETVVVLAGDVAERERLMRRFAEGHRVIAPVAEVRPALLRAETRDMEKWLRGVIDGLGLERPTVALSPDLAWLAERLVTNCGDALDIVLMVAHPAG